MAEKKRCTWCGTDPLYVDYHDKKWGVPEFNSEKLFADLFLEGMQAGLSWITVLRKRENFRKAFAQFDPRKIARFNQKKLDSLMQNEGIIRNRLKIHGSVKNARAWIEIEDSIGFSNYIWDFVDGKPINNKRKNLKQVPATTDLSDLVSKDLKKRGFTFVGSTIVYAFMQASGLVNDHTIDCFRYKEVSRKKKGRSIN